MASFFFCNRLHTMRRCVLILIGRKADTKARTRSSINGASTNKELLDRGEQYFIGGPHDGIVCIRALGPGSYWKRDLGTHIVVGEGIDGQVTVKGDSHQILMARRRGEVWGRWYSKFCSTGEMGFMHFRKLLSLSREEYIEYKDTIDGYVERDKWANI
jgi:hypothetical protein